MSNNHQIVYVYRSNAGVVTGVFACVFGILGIFTLGFIFVPLAVIFSLIGFVTGLGLLRGFTGMSGTGMLVSFIGGILAFAGLATSPSLWLLFGVARLVAAHNQDSRPQSTNDVTVATQSAPPSDLQRDKELQNYCAGLGTKTDVKPIPELLVPYANSVFFDGAASSTEYRCIANQIYICENGNGFNCDRPSTKRHNSSVDQFCRENPSASSVPFAVSGHGSVYAWKCVGTNAAIAHTESTDKEGFRTEMWVPIDPNRSL